MFLSFLLFKPPLRFYFAPAPAPRIPHAPGLPAGRGRGYGARMMAGLVRRIFQFNRYRKQSCGSLFSDWKTTEGAEDTEKDSIGCSVPSVVGFPYMDSFTRMKSKSLQLQYNSRYVLRTCPGFAHPACAGSESGGAQVSTTHIWRI